MRELITLHVNGESEKECLLQRPSPAGSKCNTATHEGKRKFSKCNTRRFQRVVAAANVNAKRNCASQAKGDFVEP